MRQPIRHSVKIIHSAVNRKRASAWYNLMWKKISRLCRSKMMMILIRNSEKYQKKRCCHCSIRSLRYQVTSISYLMTKSKSKEQKKKSKRNKYMIIKIKLELSWLVSLKYHQHAVIYWSCMKTTTVLRKRMVICRITMGNRVLRVHRFSQKLERKMLIFLANNREKLRILQNQRKIKIKMIIVVIERRSWGTLRTA